MDNLLKNIQLGGAIIVFIATIFAFGIEVQTIIVQRSVALGDLLLLFIYLEVLGMVASYWGSQRIQLTYPLFIAITAIARLIILQSKDLEAVTLIYESAAILIISISILVLRIRRSKLIQVSLDKNDL
ncbi:MAG: phosphate-starvation-inducible PsiE family protein [Proteobacteria bacterium]|jgi:protein PsiE|nr:phosphate-starvation-inducible PsiE family protein [Pseudomonadota bacterium]MDA0972081.1 phosphate-starvation-inducible PsiE family protein [Pseudomonadota bacterium]MDA0996421.1 phosphate-starvation-inducible PsiE family protein [Pseudomonadota bacterium]